MAFFYDFPIQFDSSNSPGRLLLIFGDNKQFIETLTMFTLYRIGFYVVLSYTVRCERMFFAEMVIMILKIFDVKRVFDKSKR